jgi:RNA polymerase sigma-70 factor (ECF subfamily)
LPRATGDEIRTAGTLYSVDLEDVLGDLAPRLLRYATGRTGDPGLGEEIAQETLTALVQRWRRLGPPDSPEAFAFAIARRRAGRAVVKRRLLLPLTAVAHYADSARNPEDLALANGDSKAVRLALAQLPRHDREALLLVVAGELRATDAAKLLGITESAVRMRTFRGRRRLLRLLENSHGYGSSRRRSEKL